MCFYDELTAVASEQHLCVPRDACCYLYVCVASVNSCGLSVCEVWPLWPLPTADTSSILVCSVCC